MACQEDLEASVEAVSQEIEPWRRLLKLNSELSRPERFEFCRTLQTASRNQGLAELLALKNGFKRCREPHEVLGDGALRSCEGDAAELDHPRSTGASCHPPPGDREPLDGPGHRAATSFFLIFSYIFHGFEPVRPCSELKNGLKRWRRGEIPSPEGSELHLPTAGHLYG